MNADLVTQLIEAITETEDAARHAVAEFDGPQWTMLGTENHIYEGDGIGWSVLEELPRRGRQIGEHIVLHDPASVLRRCGADRELVAQCQAALQDTELLDPMPAVRAEFARLVLQKLAEGYGITETGR